MTPLSVHFIKNISHASAYECLSINKVVDWAMLIKAYIKIDDQLEDESKIKRIMCLTPVILSSIDAFTKKVS